MKGYQVNYLLLVLVSMGLTLFNETLGIRVLDGVPTSPALMTSNGRIAIFALGSFWRAEAAFGCLPGVIRTTAGYCGGTKLNPEYRLPGDHAEAVEVEYDPNIIRYEQLLDIFWSSHDPTQVFGQGPDVGEQYRSIIFTNGRDEAKLATVSKEREQTRLRDNLVTTEIKQLETFYPAEPEHQKFELRRNSALVQFLGAMSDEDFERSKVATKMNSYAGGMCSLAVQKTIEAKLKNALKYWPLTSVLKDF